jgi:DNA-binding HxlR family transcriptional regulator
MPAFRIGDQIYNNPVQLCLDHVGGKWKLPIIWRLRNGKLRYSELKRSLNEHLPEGQVSDRTLSIQLKELEQSGLISKKVYAEIPPRTEYTLTNLGEEVIPCIKSLQKLGASFMQAMKAREL